MHACTHIHKCTHVYIKITFGLFFVTSDKPFCSVVFIFLRFSFGFSEPTFLSFVLFICANLPKVTLWSLAMTYNVTLLECYYSPSYNVIDILIWAELDKWWAELVMLLAELVKLSAELVWASLKWAEVTGNHPRQWAKPSPEKRINQLNHCANSNIWYAIAICMLPAQLCHMCVHL